MNMGYLGSCPAPTLYYTNSPNGAINARKRVDLMKPHYLIGLAITSLVTACGGSSGVGTTGTGTTTGSNNQGVTLSVLERNFPVSENGSFSSAIDQGFVCIDEIDQEYYQLIFDAQGNIAVPGSGVTLSYTTTNNNLNIDVTNALGAGASYQHAFHIHAGDLVVGFIGNLTDGVNNAAIACIAAQHNFTDAVPNTTTIACRSSSPNNSFDFSEGTTNTFTLAPDHYAERNFSSFTYSGGVNGSLSFANQARPQPGTYLYDQVSGEFVMGFMRVDLATPDVELLVFEGLANGNEVQVELGSQLRACEFE